jgi:large subunit ribosomal protein L29
MTKAPQLREMSKEQLHYTLTEAQKELFRLRFQAATEKLDAPSNLRKLRREIARIHTIQGERETKDRKAVAAKAPAPQAVAPPAAASKKVAPKAKAQKTVPQKTAAQTKS